MAAAAIRFDEQVAVVTGAGGGIGRATALLLASRGAKLVINDPAEDLAEFLVSEIVTLGGCAVAELSAVDDPGAAAAIVGMALDSFGRLDILINNAGISRPARSGDNSDGDLAAVFAVNLIGPYELMRAAWPTMRAQGYGRVLNTASSAAMGSGFSAADAPSKAGVIGLAKEAGISSLPLGILVKGLMPPAYTSLLDKHPDPGFRAWMREHFKLRQVAALSASWSVATTSCHRRFSPPAGAPLRG